MATLTIDNFGARLTQYNDGDINSGYAKYRVTNGVNVFSRPGSLTWNEAPVQIDVAGAVITDLIMACKERVESGIAYVYAIGHTGRLYKIQVNDPATFNPNYDNPVLLATLTLGTPTFTRGSSLEFFGSTERIYIGHDKGVTRIDFNGTNETVVGILGSWVQTVPRPLKQFIGSLFIGNGSNIAQIDSTATVTTYTKLSPAFPSGTQVRDIDVSSDGNYLQIVVSQLALPDVTSTSSDSALISNADSFIFQWNGTDMGYTSFNTYTSFSLTSNITFGSHQFVFGYDISGSALYDPLDKVLSLVITQPPMPNAIGSGSNLVGWIAPESFNGVLRAGQFIYGVTDHEIHMGFWRQFSLSASGTETDIIRVPSAIIVSNFNIGSSSNGYFFGVLGMAKYYFSTLETSSAPTTKYKFYKSFPVAAGFNPVVAGVYETQTQLFSKKVKLGEVRLYTEPLTSGVSFTVDLIGSAGTPITGASQTFTVGSNVSVGQDYIWYTPQAAPTYAVALRVTNIGPANWVGSKCEIDHEPAGK